ncbi:MAG: hypothetical protein LBS69_00450 [Prevotellaceae bacterium]|jgi:hypothetical protein|nr:hypothetical protein [Prevotellaceae bacterium]
MSRQGQNIGRKRIALGISRELPTVFHVIGNASRENLGGYYVSTNVLSIAGHFH